jgi:hypothetical protein
MKKYTLVFLFVILVSLVVAGFAAAQGEQLTLRMSRDWGYGGFNGDIQGLFSMRVTGPANLARVVYYVDSAAIGEVGKAPFNLQFNTDNYSVGIHELYAIGYSNSGQEYRSNTIKANFVSASASNGAALKIVIPILVIAFGVTILAALVPILTGRKRQELQPGAVRQYPLGGAICPKCHRPFAIHFWGLNLFMSKYDRCPYCGKWSVVKFASSEKLRAAEQAELEGTKAQIPEATEEDKLKKDLDDSKYQGL